MFELNEEMTPERRSKIITQINAKVSWGDTRESVQQYARTEGLPLDEVTPLLDVAFCDRDNRVREAGISYLIVGAVLLVISVIIFVVVGIALQGLPKLLSGMIAFPAVYCVALGLFKICKGGLLVVVGDRNSCLSDLDGSKNLPGIRRV